MIDFFDIHAIFEIYGIYIFLFWELTMIDDLFCVVNISESIPPAF